MSIDQHVNVTLLVSNAGVSRLGFGTIGILTYKDLGADKTRAYSSATEAVADGVPLDSPEGLALTRAFSQSPRPKQVKLLAGTRKPTMVEVIEVSQVANTTKYEVRVKGEGVTSTLVTYTSDGSASELEILTNLTNGLNAVVGKNYTAVKTDPGSDPGFITITGTAPADWFSIEIVRTDLLSIENTTADPGVATDLAEIYLIDGDWYYLKTNYNSTSTVDGAADWVEATPFKAYIADSNDTDVENTAAASGDIFDALGDEELKSTLMVYHRKPDQMIAIGIEGRISPLNVGTWTTAYKTIVGCTADKFTTTQFNHLDDKKVTYYKSEADRSITWEGKVGNSEYAFFDVKVGLDFVLDGIQKAGFGVFVAKDGVDMSDEGIAELRGAIEGFIDIAKSDKHRIVSRGTPNDPDDPVPLVTFPRVAEIDAATRSTRRLPDGEVSFRYQGKIHTVDVTVRVSF